MSDQDEIKRLRESFLGEAKRADYWAQRCLRIEAAAKRVLDNASPEGFFSASVVFNDEMDALEEALKPEGTRK